MGLRLRSRKISGLVGLAAFSIFTQSCSSNNSPNTTQPKTFPRFTPALKAAAPSALGGFVSLTWSGQSADWIRRLLNGGIGQLLQDAWAGSPLPTTNLQSNFFQGGAADVWRMLNAVDSTISNINQYAGTSCSGTPVAYTVTVFSGTPATPRTFTMYAQCYQQGTASFAGDPALTLIGVNNGITYVWQPSGASWTLAMQDEAGNVHIIYGVGYNNGLSSGGCGTPGHWDSCSYAVAELATNISAGASGQFVLPPTAAPLLEMTGAGINIGYCGVQFVTDGNIFFGTGSSADPGNTCSPQEDFCAPASNIGGTTTGGICAKSYSQFTLPPIGMSATTGASGSVYTQSQYPGVPDVAINGTGSDNLHFSGPLAPPAGVPSVVMQGVPAPAPTIAPVLLDVPFPAALDSQFQVDNVYVASNYPNAANTIFGPHPGIHYSPLTGYPTQTPYNAMADGTITSVERYWSTNYVTGPTGPCVSSGSNVCSWNVNVTEQVSPIQSVIYQFETFAGSQTDLGPLTAQLAALAPGLQIEGSHLAVAVKHGDFIGNLISINGAGVPRMHIGFINNNTLVCPQPYFLSTAYTRTMNILHSIPSQASWNLCYGN